MGNPQHYSIELPRRCMTLLEQLLPQASEIHGGERPELGPLTSTFLISMSMPILNTPIERIERQLGKREGEGYADDARLIPDAATAFDTVIRKGKLGNSPFYRDGSWRFHQVGQRPFPNISTGISNEIATALTADAAVEAAREMNASQWVSILRNAMAHGGIAYLDEHGRSSRDTPVKMYAFVSGKYGKPRCDHADADCRFGMGSLKALNILRISETDYLAFLRLWVSWLESTRISEYVAA